MRPYLAILKDSFREAVASRTLPFLLVFFTIVLAVLAPIGLHEQVPWRLRATDLADVRSLTIKLRSEQAREGDNPAKRVLERLPEGLRTQILEPAESAGDRPSAQNPLGPTRLQEELAESVNDQVLTDPAFHSGDAWAGTKLPDEARSLLDRGVAELSQEETRRLNRLLFDAAFPAAVESVPKASAEIKWLGYDLPFFSDVIRDATIDKAEVQRQTQALIGFFNAWIVGPIGLLVAVFVTSTIIPRMFEPGAIDLLLSKPVSRSGLFLARFFSGCAFVFITFSYLIIGIWLIVGTRLDTWNNGLLLTIPLLLFGFSVIYSVSAVTGLVWRNPIVSVFVAVLVWGAAFLVGFTRETIATFRNGDEVREIVPAGDTLVVSDKNGRIYQWSSSGEEWREVFRGGGQPMLAGLMYPLVGPIYDAKGDRLIAGDVGPGGSNRLIVGPRSSGWDRIDGALLPPATRSLFAMRDGVLIAAGQAGLFRFEGEPTAKAAEWGFWGFNFAPKDTKNAFIRIEADADSTWSRAAAAAVDRKTGAIVVADKGRLVRFEQTADGYERSAERDLEIEKPALVSSAGGRTVVAFADGVVRIVNTESFEDVASLRLSNDDPPRTVEVSPDGRLAVVLTHGGHVTIYDARQGTKVEAALRGQGDISAVAFASDGSLWIADRLKRLGRYDAESLALIESREGSLSTGEIIYRYVLGTLRWLLPNTYGLGNAQTYLFTDQKSEAVGGPDARLDAERVTYDVWGPIWQNAAFLAVVLGATCIYITRKDF